MTASSDVLVAEITPLLAGLLAKRARMEVWWEAPELSSEDLPPLQQLVRERIT